MKTFIADIIPKIQRYSQKLDNLTLLKNQHWVLINEIENSKIVYIFRDNNQLLISQNGRIEKATWEYLGNEALMINRQNESYLFKHGFFDENVLALKIDSKNEYAFLVNETKFGNEINSIEGIINFLEHNYLLLSKKNDVAIIDDVKILKVNILGGETLQILDASYSHGSYAKGKKVRLQTSNYEIKKLKDGRYISGDRKKNFYIEDEKISQTSYNELVNTKELGSVEIECNYDTELGNYKLKRKVTKNGGSINLERLQIDSNVIIILEDSNIIGRLLLTEYELNNGWNVEVEQKEDSLTKGDKIISSKPISPIPDGTYPIKGKWFKKLKVKDGIVV